MCYLYIWNDIKDCLRLELKLEIIFSWIFSFLMKETILENGFKRKTQKTPKTEIEKF